MLGECIVKQASCWITKCTEMPELGKELQTNGYAKKKCAMIAAPEYHVTTKFLVKKHGHAFSHQWIQRHPGVIQVICNSLPLCSFAFIIKV